MMLGMQGISGGSAKSVLPEVLIELNHCFVMVLPCLLGSSGLVKCVVETAGT
jgi:hypothetical protein